MFLHATVDPDKRAPLLDFILLQARDLSPPPDFEETTDKNNGKPWRNKSTQVSSGSSSAMPKWFKIGQSKFLPLIAAVTMLKAPFLIREIMLERIWSIVFILFATLDID